MVINYPSTLFLDNCKKTAVVLDGAIGTVEFINCQSAQCQVSYGQWQTVVSLV